MHGFRKGLRNAVIGDCHRRMSPRFCALHEGFCRGHSVHCGHIGVQMQLDTLFLRRVHAHLFLAQHDACRLHDGFFFKIVKADLALYGQVHALVNEIHILIGFFLRQKLADAHGAVQIGNVKANLDPFLAGVFALDFAGFYQKYLAANGCAVYCVQRLLNRHNRLVIQSAI